MKEALTSMEIKKCEPFADHSKALLRISHDRTSLVHCTRLGSTGVEEDPELTFDEFRDKVKIPFLRDLKIELD